MTNSGSLRRRASLTWIFINDWDSPGKHDNPKKLQYTIVPYTLEIFSPNMVTKNVIPALVAILACAMSDSFSQTPSPVKEPAFPTPNAAALGKYGDIPVSYHTGVPDISIPIYTVQEG